MDLGSLRAKAYDISALWDGLQLVCSAIIGASSISAVLLASQIEVADGNHAPHWTKYI